MSYAGKLTGEVYENSGNVARMKLSNGQFVKVTRPADVTIEKFVSDFPLGSVKFEIEAWTEDQWLA